jgi:hypothetical protein
MTPRTYRGYELGQHAEGLWSYRAHAWSMWSAPMTLAEGKAAIDAELASYSYDPARGQTAEEYFRDYDSHTRDLEA